MIAGVEGEHRQPQGLSRPPLPKVARSLPGSVTSSRVSSPRALSAHHSVHGLAVAKLAQYRGKLAARL
jgi:hypothetical protein